MKKLVNRIFVITTLMMAGKEVVAQSKSTPQVTQHHPVLSFKKTSYDFGKVPLGSNVLATYELSNTGDGPIIINKVIPPAGVTVHSYPVRPVFPGAGGVIQVKVDASKAGTINKTILVDATDKGVPHKLILKGTIKPKGK